MNYNKKKINDVVVDDKVVILRLDLNVPMKDGEIQDDNRIQAALPTIKELINKNAKIIILSHLGRVKTKDDIKSKNKSLMAVFKNLKLLLPETNVAFSNSQDEKEIIKLTKELKPRDVLVLENTRFYDLDKNGKEIKLESKNDIKLGKFWASLADVFVNDAFGTSHRAHASNVGIAKNIKESVIGLLIEKELNMLSQACDNPEKPLIAVLGGAKIADKIKTIERISLVADKILIGGGMAYTFLKAQGKEVGTSLVDEKSLDIAKKLLNNLKDKIVLPIDHLCSSSIEGYDKKSVKVGEPIPSNMMGLDIGKKTIKLFNSELKTAKTIIWNGPLGLFENPKFSKGTKKICKQISKLTNQGVFTLIGGGDSAAAAIEMGYANSFSHISTGGGASLAFLEGDVLPGIEIISNLIDLDKKTSNNKKDKTKSKTSSSNKNKKSVAKKSTTKKNKK